LQRQVGAQRIVKTGRARNTGAASNRAIPKGTNMPRTNIHGKRPGCCRITCHKVANPDAVKPQAVLATVRRCAPVSVPVKSTEWPLAERCPDRSNVPARMRTGFGFAGQEVAMDGVREVSRVAPLTRGRRARIRIPEQPGQTEKPRRRSAARRFRAKMKMVRREVWLIVTRK
jgi:hypothetical protein